MGQKKLTRTALETDYIEDKITLQDRPLGDLGDVLWEIVKDLRKLRDIIDDNQLNRLKGPNSW